MRPSCRNDARPLGPPLRGTRYCFIVVYFRRVEIRSAFCVSFRAHRGPAPEKSAALVGFSVLRLRFAVAAPRLLGRPHVAVRSIPTARIGYHNNKGAFIPIASEHSVFRRTSGSGVVPQSIPIPPRLCVGRNALLIGAPVKTGVQGDVNMGALAPI